MQRHSYEHFNLPGPSGFLKDVSGTLIDKTDPRTSLNENIIGFIYLKSKHHWGLMLKMVYRHKLFYELFIKY